MNFTNTLILIGALSGFLAQTIAVSGPQAEASALCKTTTNPQVCFKTILPHVVGPKFDIYKALEIEVSETQKLVMKTTDKMNKGGFIQGLPKSLTSTINTCKNQYSMMVDTVNETVKQVHRRQVGDGRSQFSAVISYLYACDGEFNTVPSPFAGVSKDIFDLAGNSLDIMKAIEDRDAGVKN